MFINIHTGRLKNTTWMDSVSHMDHHECMSGHLLVVPTVELCLGPRVIAVLVTVYILLLSTWETITFVRVFRHRMVIFFITLATISLLTMHCGMVRIN